ncbi:hypothetical protein ACQU0X_30905 [Pseudovibrio ascidiaceicola]|uniref:hypothetical protein n=1 Tax=Pseudovibrio ascidiaceicola TaxID=285279 RepID=UPI003D36F329
MVSSGAVVEAGFEDFEKSKLNMLLNLQNNSRKLSAIMRKELFRVLDQSPNKPDLSIIVDTQVACGQAFELIEQYWLEWEIGQNIKSSYERFLQSEDRSCGSQDKMQLPSLLALRWLDGPAADEFLDQAP